MKLWIRIWIVLATITAVEARTCGGSEGMHTTEKYTCAYSSTSCTNFKVMLDNQNPQNTYVAGKLVTSDHGDTTMITKYNLLANIQIIIIADKAPIVNSFCLDSVNGHIYYLVDDTTYMHIVKINTADLSSLQEFAIIGLTCNDPQCRLAINPLSSTMVFYSVDSTPSVNIGFGE